ncbi:MAG: hypothetical protein FJ164_03765 [Gammaproteobacteria bacterium]|nr:hypothetical protein [Gammaproteobacteria bacterium]
MNGKDELVPPTVASLSGGVAHALNNVLSVMFGAASDLEAPVDEAALSRAREAVAHACAGAQGISAALNLLALGEMPLAGGASAHLFPLEPFDLTCVLENLAATADLDATGVAEDTPTLSVRVDRDTLQSALMCAAVALRRQHGNQLPLHCAVLQPEGGRPLLFELSLDNVREDTANSSRLGHHPCQLALAEAKPALEALGVHIETPRTGCMRILVDCGVPG